MSFTTKTERCFVMLIILSYQHVILLRLLITLRPLYNSTFPDKLNIFVNKLPSSFQNNLSNLFSSYTSTLLEIDLNVRSMKCKMFTPGKMTG